MARKFPNLLFVGTGRFVIGLDAVSGAEVWRAKLPHASGNIVTLMLGRDCLFVGHSGRAYALNPRSGEIIWENGLPKTGYSAVMLAMEGAAMGSSAAAAAAQMAADAAASAGASAGAAG